MYRWLIQTSIDLRFLVLAAALALVTMGILQSRQLAVDVFPEFAPPMVEVQTEAIGLSADEVESLVTLGLEELLNGLPWLESTRSRSATGLSVISLMFQRGTEIIKARQMVQERLALAYTLPNVASPPVIVQPLSAVSRFMMVGISSDSIDPTELSLIARWTIKPRLLGVPGVANVAIWGQRLRQMNVLVDPERLRESGLLQDDIITAAGDALWVSPLSFLRASSPGSGGWIDNDNQRLPVEHYMPIEVPGDMAQIPIMSAQSVGGDTPIPMGAVAEISFDHSPLIGDALISGERGLVMVLEKFPSVSTPEITKGVEQALAELSRGLPGVSMDTGLFRLANYVEESISNLAVVFGGGAILLLLIIFGFLFNWRSMVISSASMLVSLAAAVVILQLVGTTMNTMILTGLVLAIGVIIDDSLVDLDSLKRSLRNSSPGGSSGSLIARSSLKNRNAATYSLLIVILSVVPIFFMGDTTGLFFEPMALSYVLAVVASMLVALSLTPALKSLLMSSQRQAGQEHVWIKPFRRSYMGFMQKIVRKPGLALAICLGLLAGGAALAPLLGESLIPALQEHQIVIELDTPPGTSLQETTRITARINEELASLPGIVRVGALIGRAITGDRVVGVNSSQLLISIDPAVDYDRVVGSIRATVEGYPGIRHHLQSYIRQQVSEALTGESNAVVVRIYGPERNLLRQQADIVREALDGIPGLLDLKADYGTDEPHIRVRVDLEKAALAGVKPGDVRRSAATIFSGIVVGYLFKDQKIFEVVVWGTPEARQNLSNLKDLWVEKSNGGRVRLADVADIQIETAPTIIKHESIAPYVDVIANVSGRDYVAVAEEVRHRLEAMKFPLEYHPELLGEYAEWESAEDRMLAVAIACIIAIFLIMQASFDSWRLAVVGFLALPVAMAGSLVGTLVNDGLLSLGSMVGLLAVVGIAARNSVLFIQHLQSQRGVKDAAQVIQGCGEKLMPCLASATALLAVFLPLLIMGPVPGLEIVHPMAVAVIGGLVTSTVFTLVILPALYLAALDSGTLKAAG